jgi:threonine/homoserine/homoserine lactone efflux protein
VGSTLRDMSVEFLLTSLVVAAIPGTGVVYTIASAIGGGWRRGMFATIGCTLGVVPHLMAAMLGLSGVMQAGSVVYETVRWAGVVYLVYMGISMMRRGDVLELDERSQDDATGSMLRVARRAILLNLLNPKLTVFFFAFLPQFLDTPPALLDPRLIGLGAVFMLATFTVFLTYAYAATIARDLVLRAPAVRRWLQRSLGALLVGFAARLAVTDH